MTNEKLSNENWLTYILLCVLQQVCGDIDYNFDSSAISVYELAILELAKSGFVDVSPPGQRINANLTDKGSQLLKRGEAFELSLYPT